MCLYTWYTYDSKIITKQRAHVSARQAFEGFNSDQICCSSMVLLVLWLCYTSHSSEKMVSDQGSAGKIETLQSRLVKQKKAMVKPIIIDRLFVHFSFSSNLKNIEFGRTLKIPSL